MREGDTGPVFSDVNPDVSLLHPHLLLRVSLYLGNPKMLHVCSGTFSPGIGISTWNTHSSLRPSTVEDLHCTWSPCSLWDLKYIESRGIHCPSEVCTWFK